MESGLYASIKKADETIFIMLFERLNNILATKFKIAINPALTTDGDAPEISIKNIINSIEIKSLYLLPNNLITKIFEKAITKATLEPETAII